MEKITIAIGGAILTISAILFMAPLGAAFGALSGWIVGWFFGDTILAVTAKLGLSGVAMWQLGAFLGFVGAFLKTKVTAEVKPATAGK